MPSLLDCSNNKTEIQISNSESHTAQSPEKINEAIFLRRRITLVETEQYSDIEQRKQEDIFSVICR